MYLNHQSELLIWEPYKNYSSSINEFLHDLYGWVRIFGEQPFVHSDDVIVGAHTNTIPTVAKIKDFRMFLPLRNPYDRVLSQWKYSIICGGNRAQPIVTPIMDAPTVWITSSIRSARA